MFRFASPWFLLLLMALPLVFFWRLRRHGPLHLMASHGAVFAIQPKSFILMLSALLPVFKYAALALMIVAVARPQWGTRKMNITTEGVNIVLALDLSGSMAALDFKRDGKIVTRLDAVKGVVNDFIMKRDGDRIGMVVFGSQAFTQLPLTRDYNTISFVLDHLKIGAAGPSTAIGDALGIAFKRLLDIESKSNIIILLTDGRSNSGKLSPKEAADIAATGGVKVYTIGVGSRGKAPFLVNDPLLGQRYVYQQVDMDHDTLKEIAQKTGGMFFAAKNIDELEQIYESIDRLEKTKVEVDAWAEYNDLYPWYIIPAMLLLGAYIILFNTRLMRIP
ncbi:MAG: VWA domain-containing protein [Desulfobacterium sp.]